MATAGRGGAVVFAVPDRPIPACGDPMRIRQVIQNLVSNAFRYGNDHVRVSIADLADDPVVHLRLSMLQNPDG